MSCTPIEIGRVNRQLRRRQGKTDTVDAESAALAVLAGEATDEPKLGDGAVEMIRHLKIARDTALKARTEAMVTLKTLLVNAPQALRERFIGVTGKMTLIRAIAALRPGALVSTTASAKLALRALADRWLVLDAEIKEHDAILEQLVWAQAPALMDAPGVSTGTIAEMLVVLGDNPQRIRSEAAFAKLCGVCPVPASSGKTSRHRLNRGGNRRANAALYRVANVRVRHHLPTREYIQRRTGEGKSPREIRRCLKRYIAREIYRHCVSGRLQCPTEKPLDRYRSINAICESFFATLECELLDRRRFASQAQARMAVFTCIEGFYNRRRIHSALGYHTPEQAEKQMA